MYLLALYWLLLQLVHQLRAEVSFPEVNLKGNNLVWQDDVPPRIEQPKNCRNRAPVFNDTSSGSLFYVASYIYTNNCRYVISDNDNYREYNVTVKSGDTDYDPTYCSPGSTADGSPVCLMNIVNPDYILIFCPVNTKSVVGYLMNIKKGRDGKYSFTGKSYLKWDKFDSVTAKHFLGLVRYSIGNDVILAGNNPPFMIHISFQEKQPPKIQAWAGGGDNDGKKEYLDYYANVLKKQPLNFNRCSYSSSDEKYCAVQQDNDTIKLTTIVGAFNQNECLRVRRGLVHYEASALNASANSDDEKYGFVVEAIDPVTHKVRSDKCFYSPYYQLNNLLASWTVPQADSVCKSGLSKKVAAASTLKNLNCQTSLFPQQAKGKFRIIGMEPTKERKRGLYDLPQIAVYDGVDSAPEYIGDPSHLLRDNCYVEENRVSTAFAHFIVRPIDYEHFVVICNRGYGPVDTSDRRATLIYYEYNPENVSSPLTPIAYNYVGADLPFRNFLDSRGVTMFREDGSEMVYFVQMMPCLVISLEISEQPAINSSGNNGQLCREADLTAVIDGFGVTFDQLEQCNLTTCFYEEFGNITVGERYRPDIYVTTDILTDKRSFLIGQTGCLQSYFRYVRAGGTPQYAYIFASVDRQHITCFSPFNMSAGFQILRHNYTDKFCEEPFNYPLVAKTERTTLGPIPDIPSSQRPKVSNQKEEECESPYIVDTLPAVAFASLFLLLCLLTFAAVIVASLVGRRRYRADKKSRKQLREALGVSEMPPVIPTISSGLTSNAGPETAGGTTTTGATTNAGPSVIGLKPYRGPSAHGYVALPNQEPSSLADSKVEGAATTTKYANDLQSYNKAPQNAQDSYHPTIPISKMGPSERKTISKHSAPSAAQPKGPFAPEPSSGVGELVKGASGVEPSQSSAA